MKKINLLLVVVLMICGLNSCLEGGENTLTRSAFGVVDYSSSFTRILKSGDGYLYAPQLSDFKDGGCYIVSYKIDLEAPENASSYVNTAGYYTVTILSYQETDYKGMIDSHLTDTTKVLPDEVAISDGMYGGGYTANYLFLYHELAETPSNEIAWNLSYDYSSLAHPAEENGTRCYDLFLRATRTSTKENRTSKQYFNAYRADDFLRSAAMAEKNALGSNYSSASSTFTVRVNYPKVIADSVITWESKKYTDYIGYYVENTSVY